MAAVWSMTWTKPEPNKSCGYLHLKELRCITIKLRRIYTINYKTNSVLEMYLFYDLHTKLQNSITCTLCLEC